MPRHKTHQFWIERVRVLAANERLSAEAIARQLRAEHKERREVSQPPPKGRTVRNIVKEFEALPPEGQRPYFFFFWPKSMLDGAVPWEASRFALDFLRWWNTAGREGYGVNPKAPWDRPPNGYVLWAWRLHLAAPDAPTGVLFSLARLLAMGDAQTANTGGIEAALCYRPWASKEHSDAYNRDVQRDFIPPYPMFFRGQPVPFEQWSEPYGPGWPQQQKPKRHAPRRERDRK